jgi:hypothetical protein
MNKQDKSITILCDKCNVNIFDQTEIYKIPTNIRHINKNIHYILCTDCIKKRRIYSKSKCKKKFLLDDNDIHHLKYLYISNNQNANKYFLYTDILNIIKNKYGSLDNLNNVINNKKRKSDKNVILKKLHIEQRKKELIDVLNMNKLAYKNHGSCYSYVHYGKPPIDEVIDDELEKINEKNKRRIKLGLKLEEKGMYVDETLCSCYNYINNIGYKSFDEVIRSVEVEYFLKYRTEYEKLLNKHNKNIKKHTPKKIVVKFD